MGSFCISSASLIILPFVATVYPVMPPTIAASPVLVAQSTWKLFASQEYNFSILMPGDPTPVNASTSLNSLALNIQGFIVKRYGNRVQYGVSIVDFPDEVRLVGIDENQLLDLMQSRYVLETESRLLERRNIRLNNYLGRELKLELSRNNEKFLLTTRLYIVGARVYQVAVTIPQTMEKSLARSSAGFLDSFKLLK